VSSPKVTPEKGFFKSALQCSFSVNSHFYSVFMESISIKKKETAETAVKSFAPFGAFSGGDLIFLFYPGGR